MVDDGSDLDRLAAQLDAVEGAMARLDAGTYGTCEQCGEPLTSSALEGDVTASRCASCAQTRNDG